MTIDAPDRTVCQHTGEIASLSARDAAMVRPDVDLEELLDDDIRCDGFAINITDKAVPCGRAAVLHSRGHGCPNDQSFKCITCWQAWYIGMTEKARRRGGYNRCGGCGGRFYSISDFSDYRPF